MFDWLEDAFSSVSDWFSDAGDAVSNAVSGVGTAVSDGWDALTGAGTPGISTAALDGWSPTNMIGDSWLTDAAGNYTDAGVAGVDHAASAVSDGWLTGGTDLAANVVGGMSAPLGGTAVVSGTGDGVGSKLLESLKAKAGNIDYAGAGLKLGAQALGSLAKSPGSDDMASYLNDVKAREAQVQTFNMDMATKRAGIGDSLATNANAMDPNYYATQQQTATKNRDAAGWAENEANMRTRGFDENAIAAERNRAGLTSSTNQGTSYDAGYQTGTNAKATMLGAAGSNYTQVSQPTAGLSTAYSEAAKSDTAAQKGWGNAIEQAFGITNSTTKKATE